MLSHGVAAQQPWCAQYSYEMVGNAATSRQMGGGAVRVAAWSSTM